MNICSSNINCTLRGIFPCIYDNRVLINNKNNNNKIIIIIIIILLIIIASHEDERNDIYNDNSVLVMK